MALALTSSMAPLYSLGQDNLNQVQHAFLGSYDVIGAGIGIM